jgi:5-methylcytosine-specific restriction enzyme subunit McrC
MSSAAVAEQATSTTAGSLPPKVIPCIEYGEVAVPMNYVLGASGRLLLNPQVEKGDFFGIILRRGQLTLRAGGYVGYIPLNDRIVVHVKPRVPIGNLTRIAEISGLPRKAMSSVRDYDLTGLWSDSFADLYAAALVGHVDTIRLNGLFREYHREEEGSSFPRGRILMGPTVQSYAARAQRHRAKSTWYARSIDNPGNRCLKYAMWLMAQHYGRKPPHTREPRIVRQRMNAAYSVFDGVTLDHARRFLNDPVVTGQRDLPPLRVYYREALDVALAIVRQHGLLLEEATGLAVRLPSIVLSMPDLFEAYIRKVLQMHAAETGWTQQVLDGNSEGSRSLYRGQALPPATPDVVVLRDGAPPLILEIKYIPAKDKSSIDAVRQAVTYAACYETNRVVLVHPCDVGHASGMRKLGDVGNIEVFQYRFDLSAHDLSAEATSFGQAVAAMM